MAVVTKVEDSKLKLSLQTGVNEEGEPVLKTKTFSNISVGAKDEDLFDVAEVIEGLQDLPLVEVFRVNQIKIAK